MDERFSPQSKRDQAFVRSEEEIIDLWRGFFRTDEKDNIKEFFSVEQASLFKVFSTLITEIDKIFLERDKILAPEVELQSVMDYGSRLLARVLRFSNIKSGRESWLYDIVARIGQDEKTVDFKKRLIEEKAKEIPVHKRGAITGSIDLYKLADWVYSSDFWEWISSGESTPLFVPELEQLPDKYWIKYGCFREETLWESISYCWRWFISRRNYNAYQKKRELGRRITDA